MVRQYPALVIRNDRDKESPYEVLFPDFDGCVTSGTTPDAAHAMACEALQLHVDGTLADGTALPDPSSLEDAAARCQEEGGLAVIVVPVRLPGTGRSKRINITLDEELLADVDSAAARKRMSRSALLAEGARRVIGED